MQSTRMRLAAWAGLGCMLAFVPGARADESPTERISEQFSGAGGRGPYLLAWRGFTSGSEHVYRNGLRLFRGTDYLIDYASGALAFTGPVSPTDEITIDYPRGGAQANAVSSVAPTVSLFDAGPTHLHASYLFAPAAGQGGGAAPATGGPGMTALQGTGPAGMAPQIAAMGLGGETAGKDWKFNSGLLLATGAGDFSQRSGMRFGGQYGIGALQIIGDYSRAGTALDPNGAAGFQQSRQTTSLGLDFHPSDRIRFASQYASRADLDKPSDAQTTLSHELDLKPSRYASLLVKRALQTTGSGAGEATGRTDTLQLQLTPTGRTTLTAGRVIEDQTKDGASSATTTDTLRLEQKLSKQTSALAEYQAASKRGSQTNTARVGLTTQLVPGVQVETTAYQKRTDPGGGGARATETGVETKLAAASGPLQLQTQLQQTQTATGGASNAAVDVASKGGAVKLHGELGSQSAADGKTDKTGATIEVTPVKLIKLTAGLTQTATRNPSDAAAVPARQTDQQVGVTFQPSKALDLSAGLQSSLTPSGDSNSTSFAAQLQPFSFLHLSGSLKQRDAPAPGPADADTCDAQLTLQPLRGIKLTGGYTQNPEKDGQVALTTQRQVGMETTLGSLLLSGAYAFQDGLGGAGSRTTQYGLGLNLSRATMLKATYQVVDGFGSGMSDRAAYGLSFSHNLGDRFNFTLEGQAADPRGPSSDGPVTYQGSAKLGMTF